MPTWLIFTASHAHSGHQLSWCCEPTRIVLRNVLGQMLVGLKPAAA